MTKYYDYASSTNEVNIVCTKGGVKLPFPVKLFRLLEIAALYEPELAQIMSWQPHGRCFHIHDPKRAEKEVLRRFFKQTKYSSFRRQLNLWGFKRLVQSGSDNGCYYHEMFLRGKPFLCCGICRNSISIRGTRPTLSSADAEPMFNSMVPLPPSSTFLTSRTNSTRRLIEDHLTAVPVDIRPLDESVTTSLSMKNCTSDVFRVETSYLPSRRPFNLVDAIDYDDIFESVPRSAGQRSPLQTVSLCNRVRYQNDDIRNTSGSFLLKKDLCYHDLEPFQNGEAPPVSEAEARSILDFVSQLG